jgi:hypothetical protein
MRKIEVGFSAKIRFNLDESQRNYVLTHRERILRMAAILTFSKLEDKDGAILKIAKINPVLQYCVAFYGDSIVATGFADKLDTLKDFPQIAMEEITFLIGNATKGITSGPSQYTT